ALRVRRAPIRRAEHREPESGGARPRNPAAGARSGVSDLVWRKYAVRAAALRRTSPARTQPRTGLGNCNGAGAGRAGGDAGVPDGLGTRLLGDRRGTARGPALVGPAGRRDPADLGLLVPPHERA